MQVCVVGAGYWGPNLVRNFLSQSEIDKVFVCDIDKNRLKQIKRKFPMVETESDYNKILQNRDIEAVAIATPVSTHYILAKQALEADKHVLVEKPMTSKSSEAEELIKLSKACVLDLESSRFIA